jgi:predicted RNA binding protein YcfA (HicA-like mRNA interferase family)
VEIRQRGSHIVMQKQLPDTTVTVPVPDHAELRIGTLQSIIRQSGISRSEFES